MTAELTALSKACAAAHDKAQSIGDIELASGLRAFGFYIAGLIAKEARKQRRAS